MIHALAGGAPDGAIRSATEAMRDFRGVLRAGR